MSFNLGTCWIELLEGKEKSWICKVSLKTVLYYIKHHLLLLLSSSEIKHFTAVILKLWFIILHCITCRLISLQRTDVCWQWLFIFYHHQLFVPHFCKIRATAVLLSHLYPLCWWPLFIASKHMTLLILFTHSNWWLHKKAFSVRT